MIDRVKLKNEWHSKSLSYTFTHKRENVYPHFTLLYNAIYAFQQYIYEDIKLQCGSVNPHISIISMNQSPTTNSGVSYFQFPRSFLEFIVKNWPNNLKIDFPY